MDIIRSITLFGLAGFAEIDGGYLVSQSLRESKGIWLGLAGGVILFFYGVDRAGTRRMGIQEEMANG